MSRARETVERLTEAGLTLVTVESCTGGMIAAALTDIPGSSAVVDRGLVTYSNQAKTDLAGVDPALIEAHGAVSPEVAEAMARGALARCGADIAVAVTGVAGPGGTAAKPEGRVCFHAARRGGGEVAETHDFGAVGRANVRARSVETALNLVLSLT